MLDVNRTGRLCQEKVEKWGDSLEICLLAEESEHI